MKTTINPFGVKHLDWTFDFGKWKGAMLEDVIIDDPHYVAWCVDEIEDFKISKCAKELLNEYLTADEQDEREDEDPWKDFGQEDSLWH